jgi:transcriptional regulator NrdR family protein
MVCPFCNNGAVSIIRTEKFRSVVRRIRFCQRCGMPWRTFEDSPVCQDCGHEDSDVTSSERYDETVRRTRKCPRCSRSWKSYENNIDEYRLDAFEPNQVEEAVFYRRLNKEILNG